MNLPTLHRNAIHGLVARDQQAFQAFQRDHVEPLKHEWIEVLRCIEGSLGLDAGAIGSTHTLDVDSMLVTRVQPEPVSGEVMTPADIGATP